MLLDRLLPEYDFHEVHQTLVKTSPQQADAIFRTIKISESGPVSFLIFLRELPAKLMGCSFIQKREGNLSIDDSYIIGNAYFDNPGEEITCGFIGKPWHPANIEMIDDIQTPADFIAFSQPGYIKVAANYTFEAVKDGTRVRTESRIAGTSRDATLRFLPYWMIIRLPSGFIRRCLLSALKKEVNRIGYKESTISSVGDV